MSACVMNSRASGVNGHWTLQVRSSRRAQGLCSLSGLFCFALFFGGLDLFQSQVGSRGYLAVPQHWTWVKGSLVQFRVSDRVHLLEGLFSFSTRALPDRVRFFNTRTEDAHPFFASLFLGRPILIYLTFHIPYFFALFSPTSSFLSFWSPY